MKFPRTCSFRRSVLLALLVLAAAGCSESLTVEEAFPLPLIERLPLRVALYYPPALKEFVHTELSEADVDWTIRLGNANIRMLDAVFTSLFTVTQQVSARELAASEMPGHDAVISPNIEKMELALPSVSGNDYYAVWIRYVLDVYDRDGKLIVRWPVSAYGQSGASGQSDRKAMQRAVLLALRDAEASIALGFERQQVIRERLLREPPKELPQESADEAL